MNYATANGIRVTVGNCALPFYGEPVADISLEGAQTLANPVALAFGNLTLRCYVLRQKAQAGVTTARLGGGAGGWGKIVPSKAYANPSGVGLALVLRDVAAEVGETVVLAKDRPLGAFYVRESCPASRVLRQVGGDLWWMSPAGVTQVGPRTGGAITTAASVEGYKGGPGIVTVATEDIASWMPGRTYEAPTVPRFTISETRIRVDNGGTLRLEVLVT